MGIRLRFEQASHWDNRKLCTETTGFSQDLVYTGCIKKTEQIQNRSQRREAAQTINFLLK